MGVLKRLERVAGWIIGRTGFSSVTGHAFISNVGSVYAGSGLLVNMCRDGKISRLYLILQGHVSALEAVKLLLFCMMCSRPVVIL